jgi:hypothetical protein
VDSTVSLRTGAGTAFARVASRPYLYAGENVLVISWEEGAAYNADGASRTDWLLVQVETTTGYAAAAFFTYGGCLTDPSPPVETGSAPFACAGQSPPAGFRILVAGRDYQAGDYLVPVSKKTGLPGSFSPGALHWIPREYLARPDHHGKFDIRLRRRTLGALMAWSDHVQVSCGGTTLKVSGSDTNKFTAYRSFATQCSMLKSYGPAQAAYPGFSEHHLGTAVDVTSGGSTCVLGSAADFGFVQSYPKDTESYHGFIYEPWHYRYVGRAAARYHRSLAASLKRNVSVHELIDRLEAADLRSTYEQRVAEDHHFDSYIGGADATTCGSSQCPNGVPLYGHACGGQVSYQCIDPCGEPGAWDTQGAMWKSEGVCPNGCDGTTGLCVP